MASTIEKVSRLLNAAGMDDYGDGEIVTAVITGYAEPRYGNDESIIVLGNWNPAHVAGEDRWKSKDPRVTLPVRLAAALERVGASIEWCDEWMP